MTVIIEVSMPDSDEARFTVEPPRSRTFSDDDAARALECLERAYVDARMWIESRTKPYARTVKPDAVV